MHALAAEVWNCKSHIIIHCHHTSLSIGHPQAGTDTAPSGRQGEQNADEPAGEHMQPDVSGVDEKPTTNSGNRAASSGKLASERPAGFPIKDPTSRPR